MGRVVAFAFPSNLVDSVRSDACTERGEWLHDLPTIVGELAGRWSLRLAPPYQPGGRCACPTRGADCGPVPRH
jgi:streptomycin 6-kinase